MNNKLKLIIASTLVAFVTTGCSTAPAPWAQKKSGGGSSGNGGVTHSHNGQVHTHRLPSSGIHHSHNQSGGGSSASTNNSGGSRTNNTGGVSHTHGTSTHTHPLPAEGINHNHGGAAGRANGSGGGNGGSGRNGSYTDTYDYGSYDNPRSQNNDGYYDKEYPRRDRGRDGYSYDNRSNDSGYGRTKDSYYDRSSDSSSNYDSGSSSSDKKYTGGKYYTVQRKDTVFEVMRQTGAYWKDIIRLNDLKAPKYEIHPGQRLELPEERDS